jgi:transposase-like protein
VLDFLVQRRRNAKAAMKLMIKLLKKYGFAPTRIVTEPPPILFDRVQCDGAHRQA